MVAGGSPDWLPSGWTVHSNVLRSGRETRCYTNLETGKTCFSKEDVMQCINMGSNNRLKPQPTNTPAQRHSGKNHMQLIVKQDEYPDWLPDGWTMGMKTRQNGASMGHKYKVYVDPLFGCKFYSKPEVFLYLKTIKHKSYTPEKPKKVTKRSAGKVVVEECTDKILPPGWKKEIRIKNTGTKIRRDPYYTDPDKGYIFRSRKEVMRYLETGEMTKYTLRQKERKIRDQELMNEKSSSSSAARRKKISNPATSQQRTAGNGSFDSANSVTPKVSGSKKKWRSKRLRLFKGILDTKETAVEESGENNETTTPCKTSLPLSRPEAGGSEKQQVKRASKESTDTAMENTIKESVGNEEIINTSNSARSKPRSSRGKEGKTDDTDDLQESGMEMNGRVKTRGRKKKSKNNNELNLPRRSSNRLAGIEPKVAVHGMFSGSSANNASRDSNKSKVSLAVSKDSLAVSVPPQSSVNGVSECHILGSGETITHKTCPQTEPMSNKRKKPLEDSVYEKQMQQLEAAMMGNEKAKAGTRLFFPSFGEPSSVPCFKTRAGAFPVDGTVDMRGMSTPVSAVLQDTALVEKRSITKTKFDSSKPMNIGELSSRRCVRFDHEHASARGDSGFPRDSPEDRAKMQIKVDPSIGLTTVTNTRLHVKPSNQSKKPPEDLNASPEPPQNPEIPDAEKTKACTFPILDFWSDPCLEFAFKTLTGAIPIDKAIHISQTQRTSSPALPDLGSPSSSQTIISSLLDGPEKPSTRKELLPPNSPSLPREIASLRLHARK